MLKDNVEKHLTWENYKMQPGLDCIWMDRLSVQYQFQERKDYLALLGKSDYFI